MSLRLASLFSLGLFVLTALAQTPPNPLPHLDEQFGCLSSDAADRYIRDFSISISSFGGRELCRPDHDGRRILADVYLIEHGRFGAPRPNTFLRNFVPADRYYEWMRSQTRGMRRGNDIPYATAYNSMGYFTFQDGWSESSTLGRVGTIIHEARHTAGYRHFPCVRGPYGGATTPGCDTSLAQAGSHGVEMEYYARVVLLGQNFHPTYKAMARLMALGRSNAFFNTPAIRQREGLVLQRPNGRGYALYTTNPARLLDRPGPVIPSAHLKRSSFGAVLFTGSDAFGLDLYSRLQGNVELRDAYSYFKMLARRDTRQMGVRDLEEFDIGQLRYLAALTRDNHLYTYDFPNGKWASPEPVAPGPSHLTTVDPEGSPGLYVVAASGVAQRWNPQTKRLEAHGPRWASEIRQYVRLDERVLALGQNGVIYAVDQGRLVPFDALRGVAATELVSVPLYDAFDVEN